MRVSDTNLMKKVSELGLLSTKDQTAVLEMFTEMRDLYEERGLHPEIDEAEAAAAKTGATGVIVQ